MNEETITFSDYDDSFAIGLGLEDERYEADQANLAHCEAWEEYEEHDCHAGPEDGCEGCQKAFELGLISEGFIDEDLEY